MSWERADPGPANPLAWSVPIGGVRGLRFRLHFSFLFYALLVLLRSAFGPDAGEGVGIRIAAMALGALLLVNLVREAVRALVVRGSGGEVDPVVLWPLGSLQGIEPAPGWRAAFVAALAGPAASAAMLAAVGIVLGIVTGEWIGAALPDPFVATWLRNPHPWWIEALWLLQWTGLQVALLALLPMLPLDGGRVVAAFLLRARGEYETPRLAATVTLVAAGLVGIVALVRDLPTLLTVAIACAGYAALILWRLRAGDRIAQEQGPWSSHARRAHEAAEEERAEAAAQAAQQAAMEEALSAERELDRILEKIAREGKDRLTRKERATLERETRRRRGEDDPGST